MYSLIWGNCKFVSEQENIDFYRFHFLFFAAPKKAKKYDAKRAHRNLFSALQKQPAEVVAESRLGAAKAGVRFSSEELEGWEQQVAFYLGKPAGD